MQELGQVEQGNWFEEQHAKKFVQQGYKTAFLPDVHAVHLAATAIWINKQPHVLQETMARHGLKWAGSKSAYDLAGTFR
jgi:hypothetical protein